jgi:hypothetical protein
MVRPLIFIKSLEPQLHHGGAPWKIHGAMLLIIAKQQSHGGAAWKFHAATKK